MCSVCGSSNQAEFPAELMLHFRGIENMSKPGLMIFPTVSVCVVCGAARFTIPETELALLTNSPLVECAGKQS